jgi:8-oxo-dGTP pyrophosphatase MutT (NUDIX family)
MMIDQGHISEDKFSYIVRCAPLPSLDLIIRDSDDRVLVGLRINEPAKNYYFVPGGVIRKNESIELAFARILRAETGCRATLSDARFLGVYPSSIGRRRRPPRSTIREITGFPRHGGKRRPCRDDGGGEIARCLACARKGDRAFDIDPPTASYAIMRRARPYRGENSGPGKDRCGELDTQTRN